MKSAFNQYQCCPPDTRQELALDAFDRVVRDLLRDAKNSGWDYHHVALLMTQSILTTSAEMNIHHGIETRRAEASR